MEIQIITKRAFAHVAMSFLCIAGLLKLGFVGLLKHIPTE